MSEWAEFVRSLIRPFIIVWGFTVYGVCIIRAIEVPPILVGLVTAVIVEYFGERAIRRWREK